MVRDNDEVAAEDIVHTGYNGIKCVEAGGPEPGVGCAGRGIIVALEKLRSLEVLTDEDLIMYDVLGDVVCGGFAEGYAKAAKKLFAQLLPQTATAKPLAVNILGQSEFYLQGAADTRELKRLLQLAGYEVLCTPGCECTLEELQKLPEASLNIVTNAELGLPLAEYLQKKYGTPYIFAGLPYGVQGTLRWLQQINAQLPAPALDKVTAEAQAQDNYLLSRNNEAIALWGSMWFDNVLVSAPATQALCLAQTLRTEWTDIGSLTVICQQPLKDAPACDTAEAVSYTHLRAHET